MTVFIDFERAHFEKASENDILVLRLHRNKIQTIHSINIIIFVL